uniref:4-vinylanisole receptor n=1 Tax=Locusta migratoria TaxID=7004 RepID=OR35_LOCMI|nr:odorant receptor 35 [Locusta migratoria]
MAVDAPWSDTALWLNARLLALGGMWRPPWCPARCYLLYRAWVFFTLFSFFVAQIQALWHFWGDMDKITHDVCLMISIILSITKFFIFNFKEREVFRLVRRIDDTRAEQIETGDSEITSILDASYRSARGVALMMTCLGGSIPGVWAVIPILMRRLGIFPPERELPGTSWYTGRDGETPIYETLYVLQYFSMQNSFFTAVGPDLLFVAFIIHAAGQLEVLNARLRRVGGASDARKLQKAREEEEESGEAGCGELAWRELCGCIRHHQHVIGLIKEIERMVSKIVLLQFLGATVIICVTLYQSSKHTENMAALLMLQGYLGLIMYEVFMYCWYAEDILYQNSRLAVSAYSSGWVGAVPQLQRALVFVICRTQRPLGLTAGKFYYVSRESFVSLMSASYSYYALLRQVNDK